MMNTTRAALGRAAKIGSLFDIRTESFLVSILRGLIIGEGRDKIGVIPICIRLKPEIM